MSSSKALIALALAISIGVLAVIAATLYLESRSAVSVGTDGAGVAASPPPPPIPTKDVAVFARTVKQGASIAPEDVKVQAVPLYALPPNYVVNPGDLVGRRVASTFKEGTTVVSDHLVPREQDLELAGLLVDGTRAYTVSLSGTGEVAGFVLPGNRVDVLMSGTSPTGQAFSRMLIQDVKVLAIAQDRFVPDRTVARPAGLITLEVTPPQAELLDMARSVGTLSFALRAQSDRSTTVTLGARQEELHGSKQIVEVIRGTARTLE